MHIRYYVNPSVTEENRIGGVMVSLLISSAVDRGFNPRSGQTKDYIVASPLCMQHYEERADWLALYFD